MDYNIRKFLFSKTSGIIAIIMATLLIFATVADLIEILSMAMIEEPGYLILTHVIWFCVNLLLLGFGIGAKKKPVLRLRRGVMGERKKYYWFYGKLTGKLGLAVISIVAFVLCFKMSEIFAISSSKIGAVLRIVQLVICPVYIIIAVLQVIGTFIKDPRLYDGEYKLITKKDSIYEFYFGAESKCKMYNKAKHLTSKLAGVLLMANAVLILIESIYVLIDLLRNSLALGINDWEAFAIDLSVIAAKLILSLILISRSLSLGNQPVQKAVSTEYYTKGMDREFRWKYTSPISLLIVVVISIVIAVESLIADSNVMIFIHPVIVPLGVVLSPFAVIYYVSAGVFILTALLCLISLVIRDNRKFKLESNIYNLMAGIS